MRIGIDIRTLMEKEYSGVSEYTFNLVKAILEQDETNEYKLFYNSGRDIGARMPEFNYENVEIISRRYPNKIFNYLMQKAWQWPKIDRMLGVDIFWSPHLNFTALSAESKKILTIHDLSFLRYPEFFSLQKNLWHYIINVKKLIREADKIVAVSENTKNDIIDLGKVSEGKIEVIYSGVDKECRVVDKNDEILEKVKRNYELSDKFILFFGTLEPRKNIIGLIKAYNEFRKNNRGAKDIKLVIAGGRGWKERGIFKEWRESKYKDDIKFLGYIPREEKVYLYNLALVFVYPSFYEGFGFPPLEAMACGLPTITNFAASLPEIGAGASLLIDPYKTGDIAEAIEKVLFDEKLKNDIIEKGKERAAGFRWEETAKKYLRIFKELGESS